MFRPANGKKVTQQARGYNTPTKNDQKRNLQSKTIHETNYKSNQKSAQNSHSFQKSSTVMNIFKRRKYMKRIIQSNLHLLDMQKTQLQDKKQSAHQTQSDLVNQLYQQELDKVYVVLGRISKINESNKYYICHVQDSARKEFRFYFMKNSLAGTNDKNQSKKPFSNRTNSIKNIDELEFQGDQLHGQPYFKFFVIFREIPFYERAQQDEVFNSQQQAEHFQEDSFKKRCLPKIKRTQIRSYIQHFEKLTDFNYLTWHGMQICFEHLCLEKIKQKKVQFQK